MGKRKKRKKRARPARREEYTPGVSVCCSRCGRTLAELPENATGEEWAAFFRLMDRVSCPRCGAADPEGDQDPPPSGWGLLDRDQHAPPPRWGIMAGRLGLYKGVEI